VNCRRCLCGPLETSLLWRVEDRGTAASTVLSWLEFPRTDIVYIDVPTLDTPLQHNCKTLPSAYTISSRDEGGK
jgi:hypothetical protein